MSVSESARKGSLVYCNSNNNKCTPVCLSFHPMAKEHVHALKGLACRKRVAAASSPAASRLRRSRRLRDTLAAAPGLLAHASVTEAVNFCPMGPKLRHAMVTRRECVNTSIETSESAGATR